MEVFGSFDGISCGQLAFQREGIHISKYYASEIDKVAIDITQRSFPNTIQVGDITKLDFKKFKGVDMIIGGSPCQNLSKAISHSTDLYTGLKGEKSSLFFSFVDALNVIKPKYFFLENVGSMTKENRDIISKYLGVQPIRLNSNLVSAQDRDRYYWTNIITDISADDPIYSREKTVTLQDIVIQDTSLIPSKYWYDCGFEYKGDDSKVQAILDIKALDISKRVYNLKSTVGTLTRCDGGHKQKKVFQDGRCRKLLPIEYERLQTIPDNYTAGHSDTQRWNVLGNGWTVDIIGRFFKHLK